MVMVGSRQTVIIPVGRQHLRTRPLRK